VEIAGQGRTDEGLFPALIVIPAFHHAQVVARLHKGALSVRPYPGRSKTVLGLRAATKDGVGGRSSDQFSPPPWTSSRNGFSIQSGFGYSLLRTGSAGNFK